MYSPRYCLRAFALASSVEREAILVMMLEALVATNIAYLLARPWTPSLYASGVQYEEEEAGLEDWQDIPTTLARRKGDCEDLACWRIAELRVREGERATSYLKRADRDAYVLYHVAVRRADGSLEDPSRHLGMR